MAWIALVPAVAVVVAAVGLGPLRATVALERWLLALVAAVLALALISLGLVRLGLYSPWLAAGLLGASGLGLLAVELKRPALPGTAPAGAGGFRHTRVLLAVLVVLGALYFAFPTYFLLGNQDPGVYLLYAAHIAKTGGLDLDLAWLGPLREAHSEGLALGYPGVYSYLNSDLGTDATRLSPQFMHLFPALLANVWAGSGLEGAVRMNAVLAVLMLGIGYAFVRRLAGHGAGLALVLALGLNPAFVWAARIPLTEVLAALLNLTGLLLFVLTSGEPKNKSLAVAGGIVLGLGVFNRLDAGLSVTPLFGLAIATFVDRRLCPSVRAASVAYLAASTLGFLDGFFHAPFYFQTLVRDQHLHELVALSTVTALAAFGLGSLTDGTLARLRLTPRLLSRLAQEALLLLVVGAGFVLFLWPNVDPDPRSQAARELTWYVTPVAWPLALAGFGIALRSLSVRALPLVVMVAGALFVFTIGPHVVPQHIWASRRWVPHVIPGMAVLSVIAAAALSSYLARFRIPQTVPAAVLVACYFLPALSFLRPFLLKSMLLGLPEAYTALVDRLPASTKPVVTTNPHVASILTYVYDVPTAMLGGKTEFGFNAPEAQAALGRGDFAGMTAVGMGAFELGNSVSRSASFVGDYLEMTQGRRPRAVIGLPLSFDVGALGGSRSTLEVPARHPRLVSEVGVPQDDGSVLGSGRSGLLLGGPCMPLGAGNHEVDWIGRVFDVGGRRKQQGALDVVSEPGATLVASVPLRVARTGPSETWIAGVDFSLERPLECVDFRMRVESNVVISVTRLRLKRSLLNPTRSRP